MIISKLLSVPWEDSAVSLTAYSADNGDDARKPALLVLPGGGYVVCAPAEGAPVAERFAGMGYAAFVLNYSVASTGGGRALFPRMLRDVARAVAYLRENAASLGLDPERIVLLGASAGGHLAASYCNDWNTGQVCEGIADDPEVLKPNACVLLYSASELGEGGMMQKIMFGHGVPYSAEELECFSVREHVGPQTPPTILFHSATDPMVPMSCSRDLFSALQKAGIPSELHIFGSGVHATGLGEDSAIEPWPELADRFLDTVFRTPEVFTPEYNCCAQANALFLPLPLRRFGDGFLHQSARYYADNPIGHSEGLRPFQLVAAPPVRMLHTHELQRLHLFSPKPSPLRLIFPPRHLPAAADSFRPGPRFPL